MDKHIFIHLDFSKKKTRKVNNLKQMRILKSI